jgi:Protein of unknown function (DUF3105)
VGNKSRQQKKPVDPKKKANEAQKQAAKRARREERKIAEAEAKKAAARKQRLKTGAIAVLGVAVVLAIGFFIVRKAFPPELPGVAGQQNFGRTHSVNGQQVNYGTATPTSGQHAGNSARCGIFGQEIPPEFAVHSLEHGSVVIWYRPDLDPGVITDLAGIVNQFDDRVVMSPNSLLTDPIVATSWVRLKAYDGADPEIAEYIETYRGRGPESFSCAY